MNEAMPELPWDTGRMDYTAADMRAYALAAVLAERERCAEVCEEKGPELIKWWGDGQANAACMECAAAIRAGLPTRYEGEGLKWCPRSDSNRQKPSF